MIKRSNIARVLGTGVFIAGCGIASLASGAAILDVDSGGQLLGANNVEVDATLYDVRFSDERGIDLFQQPDGSYDFGPVTDVNKGLFTSALLTQVFTGVFNTDPERILGCESTTVCRVYTAFRTFTSGNIGASVAVLFEGTGNGASSGNPFPGDRFDALQPGQLQPNTPRPEEVVWAVWTATPASTVPEPGPLGLLLLAGVAALLRQRGGPDQTKMVPRA